MMRNYDGVLKIDGECRREIVRPAYGVGRGRHMAARVASLASAWAPTVPDGNTAESRLGAAPAPRGAGRLL